MKASGNPPRGVCVGLDFGSSCAKAVAVNTEGEVLATSVRPAAYNEHPAAGPLLADLKARGPSQWAVRCAVGTGVGRTGGGWPGSTASELFCLGEAARRSEPAARTVIDLGAGGNRVICLDRRGAVTDFFTEEEWPGGMHNLLVLLARALGTTTQGLAAIPWEGHEEIRLEERHLSHAEHQVVSLLRQGTPPEALVAAVGHSIARRAAKSLWFLGRSPGGMLVGTGGLAGNPAIVRALEGEMGSPVAVIPDPALAGAWGAALIAQRRFSAS